MGQPVVHFEIVGTDPATLRSYYGALFGWEYQVGDASTGAVSRPGQYGFVDAGISGSGINGGVAGGAGFDAPRPVLRRRARRRGRAPAGRAPRRDAPDGSRTRQRRAG